MNLKTLNLTVLLITILVLVPTIQIVYASSPSTFYLSGGIYPQADYTVWKEGTYYYAKDLYGFIPSWGKTTGFIFLMQYCHDNLLNGGVIQLTKGSFYDNGIEFNITNRGITVRGMGYATKWITNNGATKSPIVIKNTDNFRIENFVLISNIEKTLGSGIALENCWVQMSESPNDRQSCVNSIRNMIIENHYEGIRFENTTWVDVENVDIRNSYWKGLVFNYGASFIWLTKVNIWGINRPNYNMSVHFMSAYSIYASQCEWLNAKVWGVLSNPSTGIGNAWFKFTQCAVEMNQSATEGDAWVFTDNQGGSNEGVYLLDCWGVSAKNGLILDGVQDAEVNGGQFQGNDEHGIWLQDEDTKSVIMDGIKFAVNSRKTDNTYDNLHVDANVSYWSITDSWFWGNNIFGESGNPDVRYGICVDEGTSNWYQICNNILVYHETGAISDGGTGENKTVNDNTY